MQSKDGLAKIMYSINECNSKLNVRINHLQRSRTCREYPNGSTQRKKYNTKAGIRDMWKKFKFYK
jgi:hypothetical protein